MSREINLETEIALNHTMKGYKMRDLAAFLQTQIAGGAVPDGSINTTKLQNLNQYQIFTRTSTGTGVSEVLSLAAAMDAALGNSDWRTGGGGGGGSLTNDSVTNAYLANVPANSLKGNNTGTTSDPVDLTATQVRALLNVADGSEANQTLEALQDIIGAMFQSGTHTNATVTYQDGTGVIDIDATGGSGLSQEQVEDFVASVSVAGAGISVIYDDAGDTLTFALTGESFTTAQKNKINFITVTGAVNLDTIASDVAANTAAIAALDIPSDADDVNALPKLIPVSTGTATAYVLAATTDQPLKTLDGSADVTILMYPHLANGSGGVTLNWAITGAIDAVMPDGTDFPTGIIRQHVGVAFKYVHDLGGSGPKWVAQITGIQKTRKMDAVSTTTASETDGENYDAPIMNDFNDDRDLEDDDLIVWEPHFDSVAGVLDLVTPANHIPRVNWNGKGLKPCVAIGGGVLPADAFKKGLLSYLRYDAVNDYYIVQVD